MSEYEDVAAVAEVTDGSLVEATLCDGTPVCIFNHEGTLGAVSNLCTHSEFLISDGILHNDGTLECVWHGARFDCRSGSVLRGPATDPLPVRSVRVENGRVLVGPPLRASEEVKS